MITATLNPTERDYEMLAEALKHGSNETLDDVRLKVGTGFYVALKTPDSVVTIAQDGPALHICQMTGKMEDVPEILETVETIGKELGKEYISLQGRKGWLRVLDKFGFKRHDNEMRLAI